MPSVTIMANQIRNGQFEVEAVRSAWSRLPHSKDVAKDVGDHLPTRDSRGGLESLDYEVEENEPYKADRAQRRMLYVGYIVVRQDKFAPRNLKPLKIPRWERGTREIEGRLLFTHKRTLLSLPMRSYEETRIFLIQIQVLGILLQCMYGISQINPMREFVPVDVLQPGKGNPNGREWISGVEFDFKGVYLASVMNIGCLSVHDYETLYLQEHKQSNKAWKERKKN